MSAGVGVRRQQTLLSSSILVPASHTDTYFLICMKKHRHIYLKNANCGFISGDSSMCNVIGNKRVKLMPEHGLCLGKTLISPRTKSGVMAVTEVC